MTAYKLLDKRRANKQRRLEARTAKLFDRFYSELAKAVFHCDYYKTPTFKDYTPALKEYDCAGSVVKKGKE